MPGTLLVAAVERKTVIVGSHAPVRGRCGGDSEYYLYTYKLHSYYNTTLIDLENISGFETERGMKLFS